MRLQVDPCELLRIVCMGCTLPLPDAVGEACGIKTAVRYCVDCQDMPEVLRDFGVSRARREHDMHRGAERPSVLGGIPEACTRRSPMRVRSRPIIVDAMQWLGDSTDAQALLEWARSQLQPLGATHYLDGPRGKAAVMTASGRTIASITCASAVRGRGVIHTISSDAVLVVPGLGTWRVEPSQWILCRPYGDFVAGRSHFEVMWPEDFANVFESPDETNNETSRGRPG